MTSLYRVTRRLLYRVDAGHAFCHYVTWLCLTNSWRKMYRYRRNMYTYTSIKFLQGDSWNKHFPRKAIVFNWFIHTRYIHISSSYQWQSPTVVTSEFGLLFVEFSYRWNVTYYSILKSIWYVCGEWLISVDSTPWGYHQLMTNDAPSFPRIQTGFYPNCA